MKKTKYATPPQKIQQIGKSLFFYFHKIRNRFFPFLSPTATDIRLMFGIALFIGGWTLAYSLFAYQPNYISKSLVIVKDSAITSRYVDTALNNELKTTTSVASNPVLNTMGLLKAGAVREALWNYFETEHPKELKKRKIRNQQEWDLFYKDGSSLIKAKNLPGTDLIALKFNWSNPSIAREGMAVTLQAFQDASREINQMEQRSRRQYLQNQVRQITQDLEKTRSEKRLFKSKMNTISIIEESGGLTQARLETESQLNQILAQANGKKSELAQYGRLLGMSPKAALQASAMGQNLSLSKLYDEFYALSQKQAALRATLTDKNPKVQEVDTQIQQVRQDIDKEIKRTLGANPDEAKTLSIVADSTRAAVAGRMATSQAEANNLGTAATTLRNRLSEINRQIQLLPLVEEQLANIEQKERSLSNALDTLYEKELEAHLREAQTLSNVFIIDKPSLPNKTDFPNQGQFIALGLLLGLFSGLMALFLKYQFFSGRLSPLAPLNDSEDSSYRENQEVGIYGSQPQRR